VSIQTFYLDWERAPEAMLRLHSDDATALEEATRLWGLELYVPGPKEDLSTVSLAMGPLAACERLFIKYNRDDRPDGRVRRSMSVGDVVKVGKEFFLCLSRGFREVELG
jgi:hypothetical protein